MTTESRLPITAWVRSTGLTLPGIPTATDGTATGRVMRQGETFVITPEMYAESLDRNGNSVFNLDEAAQTVRYGKVLWSEGTPPEGAVVGADDDLIMFERGVAALKQARANSDPTDRAMAVKQAWSDYGPYLRDLTDDLRR